MKSLYFLIFSSVLTAQNAVCQTFPPSTQIDALRVVQNNLGNKELVQDQNGLAFISFGTASLVTRIPSGQAPITRDALARAGNDIYVGCYAHGFSGYVRYPNNNNRVCLTHTGSESLC